MSTNEVVSLQSGQRVKIQVGEHAGMATYVELSYDEVRNLIGAKTEKRRRYESSKLGGKSKVIGLICDSIVKGVWTTGAPINRAEQLSKLCEIVVNMSDDDVKNLTPKARTKIRDVTKLSFSNNDAMLRLKVDLSVAFDRKAY